MNIIKFETNLKQNSLMKKSEISNINNDLGGLENNLIIIYPDIKYQEILGFGGAFTEAAGYSLSKLSTSLQEKLIKDYFSEQGLNYTLCRTHINSCDFCLDTYAYSNNESLSDFSIDRDKKYIIPMIKSALKINPNINLVSTPWSPPAFMKDNNNMKNGGKLLDKYKSLWADYLVKYLEEYKKQGINIKYLTIQNEPNAAQPWESCNFTAIEEKDMIKNYISPTFKKNNIQTKLLIWDHNKERLIYRSQEIFSDSTVKDMVAGIGYHYYSGDHFENVKLFNEIYKDKLIIHTEGCTGYEKCWLKKRQRRVPNAEIYAHDIIGDLNSGANGYIDWSMVLDYNGGPTHINNSCNAPIMLNKRMDDYEKSLSYYYIGHFSRFIKPGAKRIAFSKYTSELEITAFINTDNSIVVVILNRSDDCRNFNLCVNKKIYSDNIKSHSVITLVIKNI